MSAPAAPDPGSIVSQHFPLSGPFEGDRTAAAAAAMAELADYLGVATRSDAGVPDPATMHRMLGSLADVALRIRPLVAQLGGTLDRWGAGAGLIRGADVIEAAAAIDVLKDAHEALGGLYHLLDDTQIRVARLAAVPRAH